MVELIVDKFTLPGFVKKSIDRNRLSPAQLGKMLWQDWPLLLACGLVLSVGAYVASKTLITPRFTAEAILLLEAQNFTVPELQGAVSSELVNPMVLVPGEAQILQSRALVKSVVEALNLTAYPEFNGALRGPSIETRMADSLRGWLPASVTSRLVEAGLLSPANPSPPPSAVILNKSVNAVQYNVGIGNDRRSLIINVDFTSERPDLSASVANELIKRYLDAKQQARASANKEANQALEKRIQEVHDEIDQLERRILDTRQKYNMVQVRAGSVGQQQVEDLSAALTHASADRAQLEANYQRAAVLARTGAAAGVDNSDALSSSIVGTLRDHEATVERQVAQLRTTLGPGHPTVMAAEAELASARAAVMTEAKRVMAGLGAQAAAAKAREADLRNQLAQSQDSASSLSSVQAELQQLEKDADAHRTLYQTLIQRAEQTQAMKEGPEQNGARVVSLAVPPLTPSSPQPKLAAELGLLSGLAFGGLISVGLRNRERHYIDVADLEANTGLAVVGVLPRSKSRKIPLAGRVLKEPAGVEAEALRSVRVRFRFGSNGAVPRSVLFVAAGSKSSSSDLAAAFARVAALDGLRVLLIEGDLQVPIIAQKLGVKRTNGLIKTIAGSDYWLENITRDTETPMDLLLAGTSQPTGSRLLETTQLQSFITEARAEYNLVVIDGHPLTQAMHSLAFTPIVDATVLVVEAGKTEREDVHTSLDAIWKSARRPPMLFLDQAA